ncbi:MAG: carbohydrate porin [Desulfatiglandales bacterium]
MVKKRFGLSLAFLFALFFLCGGGLLWAYDLNDKFSVDVSVVGSYQHAKLDSDPAYFQNLGIKDSLGRGSAVLDLGLNFHPTERDQIGVSLSFAGGNGLRYTQLFTLSPNADDLESDLKNINGRDRDYLLEAWYRHDLRLGEEFSLSGIFGLIDSTAYLDSNEYANDETQQFMNEVFVNNPLLNLPSYDIGGVLELRLKDLTLRTLYMGSKTEDWQAGDNLRGYGYWGLELGYKVKDAVGEGNLRLTGFTTTKDFPNRTLDKAEALRGVGISLDHGINDYLGLFLRAGCQDEKAQIMHKKLFSGGISINGKLWGREDDTIGLGYAFLDGASGSGLDSTEALEGYVRFRLTDFSHLSFDIQYLKDKYVDLPKVEGTVYGIRFTVQF